MSEQHASRIRKNIEDYKDPYIPKADGGISQCKECGAIHHSHRWYLPESLPRDFLKGKEVHPVVCPACRKIADGMPGGVLRLSGEFLHQHREDILRLIRNEENAARLDNPLERIMSIEEDGGATVIHTTNEKLAQRLGKAVHKAYSGKLDYKWSEDTKLARVTWHRE